MHRIRAILARATNFFNPENRSPTSFVCIVIVFIALLCFTLFQWLVFSVSGDFCYVLDLSGCAVVTPEGAAQDVVYLWFQAGKGPLYTRDLKPR